MSHAQLTLELIKDLERGIGDTLGLETGSYQMIFQTDDETGQYLAESWAPMQRRTRPDSSLIISIPVEDIKLVLNIVQGDSDSVRNKPFLRRLTLGVQYQYQGLTHQWQGKTSDQLNNAELGEILTESFPVDIGGNFRAEELGSTKVILLTISLFSIFWALYFIRT